MTAAPEVLLEGIQRANRVSEVKSTGRVRSSGLSACTHFSEVGGPSRPGFFDRDPLDRGTRPLKRSRVLTAT